MVKKKGMDEIFSTYDIYNKRPEMKRIKMCLDMDHPISQKCTHFEVSFLDPYGNIHFQHPHASYK